MQKILFICTGNYYRSRFAEEYFNHLAETKHLPWKAYSRGLSMNMPNPDNPGPISMHAKQALLVRNITGKNMIRYPLAVQENDFYVYDKIIALSEKEHRPMLEARFNEHMHNINFFEVGDLPVEHPGDAMNKLGLLIEKLILQLQ